MYLEAKAQRLIAKLDRGEPLVGVLVASNSPALVEILAYVGFDFVFVDQMFSSVDWQGLTEIVRAARGSDLAVLARIENDPWFGADDPSTSARAARAMGVGCDGVKVNVYSARQAASVLAAVSGWHRNLHIVPFTGSDFAQQEHEKAKTALVVPSVESEQGIKETPQILATPGLRVFGIAVTDTTRMLGYPMQYEHPEVWKFIDATVEQARSRGVDVCANTGYEFRSWDDIAGRAQRMYAHGIRMILVQTPEFLFQVATTELLKRVRGALG